MDNYFEKTLKVFDFLTEEYGYDIFESKNKPGGFYITYANALVGFRIDIEVYRGFSLIFTIFQINECNPVKNMAGEDIGHYPNVIKYGESWFFLGELMEKHIDGFSKRELICWGKKDADKVLEKASDIIKEHHETIFDPDNW